MMESIVIAIAKSQEYTQSPAALISHSPWPSDYEADDGDQGPSISVVYEQSEAGTGMYMSELELMLQLDQGWDGYKSPAPSDLAVGLAKSFLQTLAEFGLQPRRVAPSVVGGVGVTQRRNGRKVYVEFYNNGKIFALFSDGETRPKTSEIAVGYASYSRLIGEMQRYLDA